MSTIQWHIQLTLASSTKTEFLKICEEERRSAANMVRVLIEQEIKAREAR